MAETTDQFEEFAVNCNPAGSEVLPHVGKGEARGTPKRCSIAFEPRISPEKRKRMKYLSEVNSHPRLAAKELVG